MLWPPEVSQALFTFKKAKMSTDLNLKGGKDYVVKKMRH